MKRPNALISELHVELDVFLQSIQNIIKTKAIGELVRTETNVSPAYIMNGNVEWNVSENLKNVTGLAQNGIGIVNITII